MCTLGDNAVIVRRSYARSMRNCTESMRNCTRSMRIYTENGKCRYTFKVEMGLFMGKVARDYAELSGKLRLSICIWGRDGAIYGRSRTVNHVISGGKFTIPHSKFTRSGAKVKYTPTSPQAWSFGRAGVDASRQPCHSSSRESNPLGLVFQVSPRV